MSLGLAAVGRTFVGAAKFAQPSIALQPMGVRYAGGGLKAVKDQMQSIENIKKITSSMKMVASAKVRALEQALEPARGAATATEALMSDVAPENPEGKHVILAISSDRGLCGGVNSIIAKTVRRVLEETNATPENTEVIVIGEKAIAALRRREGKFITRTFHDLSKAPPTFTQASTIAELVSQHKFDTLTCIYNSYVNMITYDTKEHRIPSFENMTEGTDDAPEADRLVNQLEVEADGLDSFYKYHLASSIYHFMLENGTTEMSNRMSAMDNATTNAGDMIDRLRLKYNRTRQAVITTELVEIISGAESLKG